MTLSMSLTPQIIGWIPQLCKLQVSLTRTNCSLCMQESTTLIVNTATRRLCTLSQDNSQTPWVSMEVKSIPWVSHRPQAVNLSKTFQLKS